MRTLVLDAVVDLVNNVNSDVDTVDGLRLFELKNFQK